MLFVKSSSTKILESFFLFLEPQPWIGPHKFSKNVNNIYFTNEMRWKEKSLILMQY
jgi:hypothetical protein